MLIFCSRILFSFQRSLCVWESVRYDFLLSIQLLLCVCLLVCLSVAVVVAVVGTFALLKCSANKVYMTNVINHKSLYDGGGAFVYSLCCCCFCCCCFCSYCYWTSYILNFFLQLVIQTLCYAQTLTHTHTILKWDVWNIKRGFRKLVYFYIL